MYCGNCGAEVADNASNCTICGWINDTPSQPFEYQDVSFKSKIPLIMGIVCLVDFIFSYYIVTTDTSGWAGLAVIALNVIIVTPILLILLLVHFISLRRFNKAISQGKAPPKNVEHVIIKYVVAILKFQFKPWRNLVISLALILFMMQASIYYSNTTNDYNYQSDQNHIVVLDSGHFEFQQMDQIGDLLNYTYVSVEQSQRTITQNQYDLNGNTLNSVTHLLTNSPYDYYSSRYFLAQNYLLYTDISSEYASEKIEYTVNIYNFTSDQNSEINHVEVLASDVGSNALYNYQQYLTGSKDGFYLVESYESGTSKLMKYNFTAMSYEIPFDDKIGDISELGNTLYIAHNNEEQYNVYVDSYDLNNDTIDMNGSSTVLLTDPIYSMYDLIQIDNEVYLLSAEAFYNIIRKVFNAFYGYIDLYLYSRSVRAIQNENKIILANEQRIFFFDSSSLNFLGDLLSYDFYAVPNADIPVYNGELITLSSDSVLFYWDTNLDRANQERANQEDQIGAAQFYRDLSQFALLVWTVFAIYKIYKKNQNENLPEPTNPTKNVS